MLMKLQTFLKKNEISQREFARTIGVPPGTITKMIHHGMVPRLPLMTKIVRATNGEVEAGDFYEIEVLR